MSERLTPDQLLAWLDEDTPLCRGETHRDCGRCALIRLSLRALLAEPIHLPTLEKAIEAVKALRPRAIYRRYISPLHAIDDALEALDALRPTPEERTK